MGRPKGSKNKPKADEPVVKVNGKPAQLEIKDTADDLNTSFIVATTELAVIAGRNYITDKLMGWLGDTKAEYPGQELELAVIVGDDKDEYALFLDGEKVDSKHIFHADIEDVVRGVLGAR